MGNLIAFGFDRSWAANEVLNRVRTETTVEDAFVVERSASGRCIMRRDPKAAGAFDPYTSRLWREMARLLFLNTYLDLAMPRGGSALFIQVKDAMESRILRALKPYRGRILSTSLPREAEQRLKAGVNKAA